MTRTGRLMELSLDGKSVNDAWSIYTLVLQGYHARNAGTYLRGDRWRSCSAIKAKVVSTSAREVLEEWLRDHQNVGRKVEGADLNTILVRGCTMANRCRITPPVQTRSSYPSVMPADP